MIFEPTNRHILVKPVEKKEKETDSVIMLPKDYKKPESLYVACDILDIATDSKFFYPGFKNETKKQKFLVERRMLQKIALEGNEFYLILENYVLGRIKDEA
jgi:co-chaperonin GroES (HSP10)